MCGRSGPFCSLPNLRESLDLDYEKCTFPGNCNGVKPNIALHKHFAAVPTNLIFKSHSAFAREVGVCCSP